MTNFLYRLGRFSARRRWWVLGAWVAVVVLISALGSSLGGKSVDNFSVPGTEAQAGVDLMSEGFDDTGTQARIVVRSPEGTTIADPAVGERLDTVLAEVVDQPDVAEVTPFVPSPSDPRLGFATVEYDADPGSLGTEAGERLQEPAPALRDDGYTVEFGGDIQLREMEVGGTSEMIGLGVAVIVLLVAFGSVVAMGLPLATAMIGLGAGLGLITLSQSFLSVPAVAPTLATMIGLGVGIDYALFIVTRHREHLHRGMTVEESAARAVATAGGAVVFAGVTVVIAILGLQFAGIPMMATMGYATAAVVMVSVIAAITLLPALLGFAGHNIDRFKVPGVKTVAAGEDHSVASRWSRHVSDHPWAYMLGSLAILGLLITPFFSIRLGQTDAGNDPPATTTRKAYDLLSEGYGPGFNGPLLVVVEKGETDLAAAVPTLVAAVQGDDDVEMAIFDPATDINADGTAARFVIFPESAPQDAATQDLVHRLRDDILPEAREDAGVEQSLVTGGTAFFIDMSEKVTERLPVFIGAVLVMSFLLLMVVFRSILVPLKAAMMNLLGIGASYGVVVAVFQWQWGGPLIGVEEALPIISFLPMFMFAILFGLSMDYEVFLMSRIHEEYLHTGDNTASVSKGISHTARVITAAAIIMVSVFGSFAFGDDPMVKMMGIGLATAILLDATLIRMVLVPATMRLLGDRNWWLPGWLDRILPSIDLEGETGLPAPDYEEGKGPKDGVDGPAPDPAARPEPELTPV